MSSLLETMVKNGEVFAKLNALDVNVVMADPKGVIVYFRPAKNSQLDIKVGSSSKEGSVIAECVSTQKEIRRIVPKEVFGCTVKVICIPLYDEMN